MKEDRPRIDRRTALATIGVTGLGAVLAACSGLDRPSASAPTTTVRPRSVPSTTAPTSTSTTTTIAPGGVPSTTIAPACVLAPEMTEGPYYLDLNLVRSDITEGQPGAPLTLSMTIVDADGCTPIPNATVDVWHANAVGQYSGVNGNDGTFCRGTQPTAADGTCAFATIYPGWYQGRAIHVHVKVHVGGNVVHTGQLFFPDAVNTQVMQRAPYAAHGAPDTTDLTDSIYAQGGPMSTLNPTAQGAGFTAHVTVGVRQGGGGGAGLM
jgi:protocatechuate 3,4-dioxygenase beta subunit